MNKITPRINIISSHRLLYERTVLLEYRQKMEHIQPKIRIILFPWTTSLLVFRNLA